MSNETTLKSVESYNPNVKNVELHMGLQGVKSVEWNHPFWSQKCRMNHSWRREINAWWCLMTSPMWACFLVLLWSKSVEWLHFKAKVSNDTYHVGQEVSAWWHHPCGIVCWPFLWKVSNDTCLNAKSVEWHLFSPSKVSNATCLGRVVMYCDVIHVILLISFLLSCSAFPMH